MYYHSIECYEWFFFPGKEMCSLNSKFNLTPFMSPSVVRCVFCNGCKNGESSLSRSISPPPLRRQILEAEKGLLTDRDPSSSFLLLLVLVFLPHFQYDPHPTGFKRIPPPHRRVLIEIHRQVYWEMNEGGSKVLTLRGKHNSSWMRGKTRP